MEDSVRKRGRPKTRTDISNDDWKRQKKFWEKWKQYISDLENENDLLKKEVAFLKSKIEFLEKSIKPLSNIDKFHEKMANTIKEEINKGIYDEKEKFIKNLMKIFGPAS